MTKEAIIIHIPHSSFYIPPNERAGIMLSNTELENELLKMTDWYTDQLFDVEGCYKHINPVSRLIIDPERFRSDEEEEMSFCGMGAVYTKTSGGKELRKLTHRKREAMLQRYYDPYHQQLTETVKKILETCGYCIIVDAHSFPAQHLPYEKDQSPSRPDVCLGYEHYHTYPGLIKAAREFFSAEGMQVEENRPFSGSIVPGPYYLKDKRVVSLMLEINRSLYMNESTGRTHPGFNKVKSMIARFIDHITAWCNFINN